MYYGAWSYAEEISTIWIGTMEKSRAARSAGRQLSCSIYPWWWYTSGYDYPCYVWWTRCGYAIKQIYKNKIIWKHQSEMVGAFFMSGEICFLCPFLRKEVSTVANRIMGITVEIGAILAIFPERGRKCLHFHYLGAKSAPHIINKGFKGKVTC